MNVQNVDSNGNNLTVISTFAGCGGSSLGYKLAGYKELLAVEWDNNAVETFKLNFPDVPVYHGDITKLTGKECMRLAGTKIGELDVLDGSPPCQGFSTAGKRKFDDPRNSLFKEYARILKELQPKVFVMENVTGMIKGVMKQAYLQIIKTLRECGYRANGQVMNAMYYNVPQSRQRIIIIGVRNDLNIEPSHPKPQTKPIPIQKIIGHLENQGGPKLTACSSKYWPLLKYGESASKYHPKGHLFGMIKLNPFKPSPTILKSCGNPVCHWSQPRFLSKKELLLITSFPENFIIIGEIGKVRDRIGNSVPPNLMKAIAEHIKNNILIQRNKQ